MAPVAAGARRRTRDDEKYLERNLVVARAYGLGANLRAARRRAGSAARTPRWLLAALDDAIARADSLVAPLVRYRDALTIERVLTIREDRGIDKATGQ